MRLIDADALIEGYKHMGYDPTEHPEESYMEGWCKGFNAAVDHCLHHVIHAPTIEPMRWIPFKTRSLTEEEKEDHPEWDCILDCKLPDDGQRILVSINLRGHEEVQQDEFYSDDGSYLDSGYEIGTEAVAWMPLPEPWKGDAE